MNLMTAYDNATPEEKKEMTRELNKKIVKQVTLFVIVKVGLAVATHLIIKKLTK